MIERHGHYHVILNQKVQGGKNKSNKAVRSRWRFSEAATGHLGPRLVYWRLRYYLEPEADQQSAVSAAPVVCILCFFFFLKKKNRINLHMIIEFKF